MPAQLPVIGKPSANPQTTPQIPVPIEKIVEKVVIKEVRSTHSRATKTCSPLCEEQPLSHTVPYRCATTCDPHDGRAMLRECGATRPARLRRRVGSRTRRRAGRRD